MSETLKVQISRTVQFWLDGTHVGQCPNRLDQHGYGWEGQNLIRKIDEAPRTRKDGTVTVHLLPQEAVALADLADTMHQTNLDEFSMFGEARAGASLVEKLRVLGVNVPPMRYEFGTDPNPYDDETELIRIEPQDVDADGRMTFRPAEDRIVVTVDDHGVYRAQPYSALYDPPGTIAVSIRIRDLDTSGETLRTVDDVRSLRYYLADAIAQAEEWDRQTFGLYDFEIRTETVATIPA